MEAGKWTLVLAPEQVAGFLFHDPLGHGDRYTHLVHDADSEFDAAKKRRELIPFKATAREPRISTGFHGSLFFVESDYEKIQQDRGTAQHSPGSRSTRQRPSRLMPGTSVAPAGRLGVRQLAAAFENSSIFEHFAKSASKLAHSESFACKKYAALAGTAALPVKKADRLLSAPMS